jgi:hypothetical protein
MKHPFYPLLGLALLFASCTEEQHTETLHKTTLQASVDFADVHEGGDSKLTYNSKTGENVMVFTDWDIEGFPRHSDDNVLRDHNALNVDDPLREYAPAPAPSTGSLSIRYGLEYIGKGAKFQTGDFKFSLNYLEVPINAIYHYPAGPGEVYGGLGPYFAYGVGGGANGESSFGQDNGGFKRFDAGLNFRVGYKLAQGVSLDLGYDLGLANVEYANEDVTGHTRTFSINLGYQFGRLFGRK